MKKKLLVNKLLLLLVLTFTFFAATAQNFTVNGKVTDASGKPLEGASVSEKGTKNSALTTPAGTFQLNASSAKAKLVISFVGHEEMEIAVNNQTQLIVALKPVN